MSFSSVEKGFLAKSGRKDSYDGEHIATVEVENVYDLGEVVTLRFMEWCMENPTGVIALPTGRTPEFFIKTLEKYRKGWKDPGIKGGAKALGYSYDTLPDTSGLSFVMLDEFFPMLPTHRNSFSKYIRNFYVKPLGIKEENVYTFDLLEHKILTSEELTYLVDIPVIDLGLMKRRDDPTLTEEERKIQDILYRVAAFCDSYEAKIQAMGGIGFFLGGIGPDGHIAFNQEGGPHESVTGLVGFNYPSAAAAAGDLGGIEVARGKAAMTIGLRTINRNPNATIIIMASGEGKANVVREALEEPKDPKRPASSLHGHKGARFYVTQGAAMKLTARKAESLSKVSRSCVDWALGHLATASGPAYPACMVKPTADYSIVEELIHSTSLCHKKPVHLLTTSDLTSMKEAASAPAFMFDEITFSVLIACAARRLREKVEGGLEQMRPTQKSVLHTGPHHDDVMLSYHAAMHDMLGRNKVEQKVKGDDVDLGERIYENQNHFAYLTSGFHSVNDDFLEKMAMGCRGEDGKFTFLRQSLENGDVTCDYDDLMTRFRRTFFAQDWDARDKVELVIFLKKVIEVWKIDATKPDAFDLMSKKLEWLLYDYLAHHMPGDAVPLDMQVFKGCMRETEVDRVWALSRMPMERMHHLRSSFYTDDFFTPMPSLEDDAMPMAALLKDRRPEILSVAFDPEGTGPDTHYKVLQVVAAGLRISLNRGDLDGMPEPIVWGYRNVWFVFTPSDATIYMPGSEADLQLMHDTFMSCFTTQKDASFPSPFYDGPFSEWSRHLQVCQANDLRVLLGEEYFKNHPDERVRECHGFIYIKAMFAEHFLKEVEELKSKFEVIKSE